MSRLDHSSENQYDSKNYNLIMGSSILKLIAETNFQV